MVAQEEWLKGCLDEARRMVGIEPSTKAYLLDTPKGLRKAGRKRLEIAPIDTTCTYGELREKVLVLGGPIASCWHPLAW